jgi:hypothetical protein
VRELVDDGLLEGDGLLRTAQGLMRTAELLAQLLFIKGVEVVGDHGERSCRVGTMCASALVAIAPV